MKKTVAVVSIMLVFSACHDNGTRPPSSNIQLTVDDVGVIDAWMRLQIMPTLAHNAIVLKRNGVTISTLSYRGTDTVLYVQSLFPKHTYSFKAYALSDSILQDSSGALSITTMDTSNSNFTWEVTTLGNCIGGLLHDVAIINDTCVWAVGQIYNYDSAGQVVPTLYNAARWNGKYWQLLKVPAQTLGGSIHTQVALETVFAFGDSDIWTFSGAGSYSHWNGSQWQTAYVPERSGGGLKLWGTNSSSLYLTGTNGSISYYNGSSWQKLASGTTLDITDIFGATNAKTGEIEIMAVATGLYESSGRNILKISDRTVTALSDSGILTSLRAGLWFVPGKGYYVAGDGIFSKHNVLDNSQWWQDIESRYDENAIRGNGLYDIFVVCDGGDVLHFDGLQWRSYLQTTQLDYGSYYSVAIRGNLVVAVGENDQLGVIAMGRR